MIKFINFDIITCAACVTVKLQLHVKPIWPKVI